MKQLGSFDFGFPNEAAMRRHSVLAIMVACVCFVAHTEAYISGGFSSTGVLRSSAAADMCARLPLQVLFPGCCAAKRSKQTKAVNPLMLRFSMRSISPTWCILLSHSSLQQSRRSPTSLMMSSPPPSDDRRGPKKKKTDVIEMDGFNPARPPSYHPSLAPPVL